MKYRIHLFSVAFGAFGGFLNRSNSFNLFVLDNLPCFFVFVNLLEIFTESYHSLTHFESYPQS